MLLLFVGILLRGNVLLVYGILPRLLELLIGWLFVLFDLIILFDLMFMVLIVYRLWMLTIV